ncbi:MAG: Magnesium and cobalt efflux protein CorC [Opitutia bacterium UBA7350]|nr:MAG: Magnesium and cobalt efflux protein CorC [Opitutae bacterium UBA7350]
MLITFIFAITFTVGVSALCSLLEAMLLSTTTTEIEALKKSHPACGKQLEHHTHNLEQSSSAILSLNTIANTLGATITGGLAVQIWPEDTNMLLKVSLIMAIAILFFSEIIPKNVGILYRSSLQPLLIPPLNLVCAVMTPIASVAGFVVRFILRPAKESPSNSDQEIMLLAEKSEKEGNLTSHERELISNALKLDEILVNTIMTPRTVVEMLDATESVGALYTREKNIPFARMPVYRDHSENLIGIVRRRDILNLVAKDQDEVLIETLASEPVFIPDNATAEDALQTFLKHQQQLAIAVDEFGNMAGVITMEDVIEHIIGHEIYEADDPAVDMRELARARRYAEKHKARKGTD